MDRKVKKPIKKPDANLDLKVTEHLSIVDKSTGEKLMSKKV